MNSLASFFYFMKAHILTRSENEYNQSGEYFVAWFAAQPNPAEVKAAIQRKDGHEVDDALAAHIVSGGGRQKTEDTWWHLEEIASANV